MDNYPEGTILFYEGRHYMYSNFSAFAVLWKGRWWMTVEHAYQAEKFADEELKEKIYQARSAQETKAIAKAAPGKKRYDWRRVNLSIMEEIVRAKMEQHPYIQKKLLATGDEIIVENSPTDSFWGRGSDWKGKNHLGKIWMKLRSELRKKLEEEKKMVTVIGERTIKVAQYWLENEESLMKRLREIISGTSGCEPFRKDGGYTWQLDGSNNWWAEVRGDELVLAYRYGFDRLNPLVDFCRDWFAS